ncbi:MAG: hypothetical protein BWX48_00780 [Verrucomicrobia bacterium ADurb.Bin006]|jgi:hypothetical protein|nr:MAG: hypothetical protein BWX48_00780 [Verrucomicrobia bacterium ADurb.Bin006]
MNAGQSGDTFPPLGLASGPVALPPKPELILARTLSSKVSSESAFAWANEIHRELPRRGHEPQSALEAWGR